jgi:hypothetical protein
MKADLETAQRELETARERARTASDEAARFDAAAAGDS